MPTVTERAPVDGAGLAVILRRRRKVLELSQRALAAQMGCSAQYVGQLERGLRHPGYTTAMKWMKALDVDVAMSWEAR